MIFRIGYNDQFAIAGGINTGQIVNLTRSEATEVLEALARQLDFSLVDRVERESLLELAGEAQDDPDMYDVARGWSTWRNRCKALSSAVLEAMRVTEEV